MHPEFIRCVTIDGQRVSICPDCDNNLHTTSPGRIELKLMGCFAVLLSLVSCTLPAPTPIKAARQITVPLPQMASVRSMVVVQQPIQHTNNINLAWDPSSTAAGYRLFYRPGTNGAFLFLAGIARGANCTVETLVRLVSNQTNVSRIRTFTADGRSWTNVPFFQFTMSATNAAGSESIQCAPAVWPLPPPPPPNMIELNWGRVASVTVEGTFDFRSWGAVTNLTGSNVVIPMSKVNQSYRVQSPPPRLTNAVRAFYQ